MANSNRTPAIRPKLAAVPKSDELVPYVDDERDYRDILVLNAIKGAIQLLDDEEPVLAADVLRLARDRLEACWPLTAQKSGPVPQAVRP